MRISSQNSPVLKFAYCQSSRVNCNTVKGYTISNDTSCLGYFISQAQGNTLSCNSADSLGFGFYFDGIQCTGTTFRGNEMGPSYCGLYLNSEAVISRQPLTGMPPYHGNLWTDTSRFFSGFGAVNMNAASQLILQASLFTTRQNIPAHNPLIPGSNPNVFGVDNTGWFDRLPFGNSFNCTTSAICQTLLIASDGEDYINRVVADSAVSAVFIPESKWLAQKEVYSLLESDSSLRNSNPDYLSFVSSQQAEAIGILNDFEEQVGGTTVAANDSLVLVQINHQVDSIRSLLAQHDSLYRVLKDTLWLSGKKELLDSLQACHNAIDVIRSGVYAHQPAVLAGALQNLSSLQANQIPEANERDVKWIMAHYLQQGSSVLSLHENELMQIAVQCPSSGGPAVYAARSLLFLLNDSMEYDDEVTCRQQGIYRLGKEELIEVEKAEVNVFPNPASTWLQCVFDADWEWPVQAVIVNAEGKRVFGAQYEGNSGVIRISVSSLPEGLYLLLLQDRTGRTSTHKWSKVR